MSPVWQESQQYTNWLHGRLKKNGEVVGLVTVRDDNGRPKLVTPPPLSPGDYLHKEQLTDDEKEWAKRR